MRKQLRIRKIVSATLLTVLAIIIALFSLYCYVNRDRLFPERGTVVVYGRETCGITKMVRAGLTAKGISYHFADTDVKAIHDELRYKLGPKFKEPTYTYPVVHVAGRILLTPTVDRIQQELSGERSKTVRDYSTLLNGAEPVPEY